MLGGGGLRIGAGGAILLLVLSLATGQNFFDLLGGVVDVGGPGGGEQSAPYEATPEEEKLVDFVSFVLDAATTRYLTVAVARDDRGGLAVYDYPSFSAPPPRAAIPELETASLDGGEQEAIEQMLGRFFAAYLAGRSGDLSYFLPPGTALAAPAQRYTLRELVSVEQLGDEGDAVRTVLATLRAADVETKAEYVLRYRVGLERRDRWYVAQINAEEGS